MTDKKVVIVTGGFGGIGFATGKRFAKNGYQVLLADNNRETTMDWDEYPDMDVMISNVASMAEVKELFNHCVRVFGRLDVLVTAHGIHNSVKCADAKEKDFDSVMDVNVKGTFFCCREALRMMDEGVIVNVGSSVGIAADKDAPIYSMSKAAVHQLTKCLAQEHGRKVRVNCIAPGPIDTPLLRRAFGNDEAAMEAYRAMALRGIAKPEEVAEMIFFMASDACKFMNGAIVPFGGGESILYVGEPAK